MNNSEDLNERREFKYLLPERLVPYVREAARMVCKLDPYAGPNGIYSIRSLYFDTDAYDLFWANDREQGDRIKVRARCYPATGPNGPVFFEVKRRVLDVIIKSRGLVSPAHWQELLTDPGALDRLGISPKSRWAAERFVCLVNTYHLRPVMLVEYEREAYFSEIDDYARLTFDLKIECQVQRELSLEADPRAWRHVDHPVRTKTLEPMTLLELKFAGKAPYWMVQLIRRLELERYSFSKYCYSIGDQLTLPEWRVPNPAFRRPSGIFRREHR